MIVVVADDLTGAAEIGAVGASHGLRSEVQITFDPDVEADLIVIDTHTRSCSSGEAAARVGRTVEQIHTVRPAWMFKKTDSVLRGPVFAELKATMSVARKNRSLLVPANPDMGRTIQQGRYLINGQPVDETSFAEDPEHPARTSDVLELLGSDGSVSVQVMRPGQSTRHMGITLGETRSRADVHTWASRLDDETIPAGAAEFFAAILEAREHRPGVERIDDKAASGSCQKALFVCGSCSAYSRSNIEICRRQSIPVIAMPSRFLQDHAPSSDLMQEWADAAVMRLKSDSSAIMAIDQPVSMPPRSSLRNYMVEVVERVLSRQAVDHVYIEGGGTASELVRRLRWDRLKVCYELSPGVVTLQVAGGPGPLLTIKPGSYLWPDRIHDRYFWIEPGPSTMR